MNKKIIVGSLIIGIFVVFSLSSFGLGYENQDSLRNIKSSRDDILIFTYPVGTDLKNPVLLINYTSDGLDNNETLLYCAFMLNISTYSVAFSLYLYYGETDNISITSNLIGDFAVIDYHYYIECNAETKQISLDITEILSTVINGTVFLSSYSFAHVNATSEYIYENRTQITTNNGENMTKSEFLTFFETNKLYGYCYPMNASGFELNSILMMCNGVLLPEPFSFNFGLLFLLIFGGSAGGIASYRKRLRKRRG